MKLRISKPSLIGVLFLTIFGISCEGVNLTGLDDNGVLGSWKLQTNSAVETYLSIDEDSLIFRSSTPGQSCKPVLKFEVKRIEDGSFFFLRELLTDEELVLAISRNDERVDVRDINDPAGKVEKYSKSEIPVEMFTSDCQGHGGNNGNGNGGGNGGNGNKKEVFGNWETFQGNQAEEYVSISDSLIIAISFDEIGSCFLKERMRVISIQDSLFTVALDSLGSEQDSFIITSKGNAIELSKPGASTTDAKRYRASEVDLGTLNPECTNEEIPDNPEFAELTGQWETLQGNTAKVYLNLTLEELIRFETQPDESCYIFKVFSVGDVNGTSFTISDGETVTNINVNKTGNNINISYSDGVNEWEERYKPSKQNFSELTPVCRNETPDEPFNPLADYIGDWETLQGSQAKEYISFKEDSLTIILENQLNACYSTKKFEIEEVNGDNFLLVNEETTIQVQAAKKGNNIELTFNDGSETRTTKFKPTKQDVESLAPECNNEVIEEEPIEYLGQWETFQGNQEKEVLLIAETQITAITELESAGCYTTQNFEVKELTASSIVVLDTLAQEIEWKVTLQGKNIEITKMEDGVQVAAKYKSSDTDMESLTPDCEDVDGDGTTTPDDGIEVLGDWETQQGNKPKVYVSVAEDFITFIDYIDELKCYEVIEFEITGIDGEVFNVLNKEGVSGVFTISKKGNNIEIKSEVEGIVVEESFKPSKEDFSTFRPLCTPE